MGFQILDKDNKALTMKELDAEAAAFWNKQLDQKYYANPSPEGTNVFNQRSNWFDTIGYAIHSPECNWTQGWGNVKNSILTTYSMGMYKELFDDEKMQINLEAWRNLCKDYFGLIDHWESKGYQPKKIED